jgi:hypothetical protein
MAQTVTWPEFLAILLIGAAPAYFVAALAQATILWRARAPWPIALGTAFVSIVVALPLTVAAWWASAFVPGATQWMHRWATDSFWVVLAYVGAPAVIAAAVTFSATTWLALRWLAHRRPATIH